MSDKTIFEMDKVELNSAKQTLKGEIDGLQTEFNNKTVNIVFGRTYEVLMKYNGKETTVRDFIETEDFEKIVNEGTDNYGVLCGNLFSKKGVNNDEVKAIAKNIGVSVKVFWIIWKQIKINFKQNKIEQIEKQLKYLKEKEEEEKKVGKK